MSRQQPESRILGHIRDALKAAGAEVAKIHGDEHSRSGEPDLIGCYQGRTFVIEVKQPGEKPELVQDLRLWQWHKAGALVGFAVNPQEALAIMRGSSQHESVLRRLKDQGMESPD